MWLGAVTGDITPGQGRAHCPRVSLAGWAEQGPGAGSFVTRGNTETRAGGGGVTSHVTPRDSAHLGRYGTVVL